MSVEQTPDIETVLARSRCQDVHGDMYTPPYCESCRSWAVHVAQALAPVLAAADERGYLRGYEAGLLAPQSEWMKARDQDLREARAAELREAAEDWTDTDDPGAIYADNGDVDLWLRDRADRITEPVSHEAATSGEEASKA